MYPLFLQLLQEIDVAGDLLELGTLVTAEKNRTGYSIENKEIKCRYAYSTETCRTLTASASEKQAARIISGVLWVSQEKSKVLRKNNSISYQQGKHRYNNFQPAFLVFFFFCSSFLIYLLIF